MQTPVPAPLDVYTIEGSGPDPDRYYSYIEPDPSVTGPLPLVLALHGGGGNMAVIANQLGLLNPPSPRPYLTVIPQGHGPVVASPSPLPPGVPTDGVWNSGHAYYGGQVGEDDVAFIDAVLLDATRRTANAGWRIDQSRTYAVGFSNGGMMAYRLAAERSNDFAAIAVMQCAIGGNPAPDQPFHVNHPGMHDADPVSVMHFHGLIDPKLSLSDGLVRDDGYPRSDLPVQDAIDIWVEHNRCDRDPTIDAVASGLRRTWSGGVDGSQVQLITMPGVAHEVPDRVMGLIEPFFEARSR